MCGHSEQKPWPDKPAECSRLCVHEIANGPNRQKSLDQPYALLVLCWFCNSQVVTNKREWSEARQLALLREKAPENFDLAAYNLLVNPRAPQRIEMCEVEVWIKKIED